jgi:hypothetical protein
MGNRLLDALFVGWPRPGVTAVEPHAGAAIWLDHDIDNGHCGLLGTPATHDDAVSLAARLHHTPCLWRNWE